MWRQRAAALTGAALVVAALVGAALVQAGCAQRKAPPEVPAVLTNPTEQSRAELSRVVGEAMNGVSVTIADGALTLDDTLIIEPFRTARREGHEPGRTRNPPARPLPAGQERIAMRPAARGVGTALDPDLRDVLAALRLR